VEYHGAMSYESNIAASDLLFAGEDKTLSYEVFAAEGETMEDVSSFTLQWELRPITVGKAPYRSQGETVVTKTTGDGITITGTYNADRATNTQRVIVMIADTDTEALAGGRYVCALKRMDAGLEAVLSHGTVELLVAPVR
jgi:hypothetical protein